MVILVHSGQTGVERGAQRAALALGIPIAGFCTADGRDELGRLPPLVARDLTPCHERGPRSAIQANLAIASAVVLVVPVAARLSAVPGAAAIVRSARSLKVPCHVVDSATDRAALCARIAQIAPTSGSVRVLVTGPRQTRWAEGERVGRQILAEIAGQGDVIIGASPMDYAPTSA